MQFVTIFGWKTSINANFLYSLRQKFSSLVNLNSYSPLRNNHRLFGNLLSFYMPLRSKNSLHSFLISLLYPTNRLLITLPSTRQFPITINIIYSQYFKKQVTINSISHKIKHQKQGQHEKNRKGSHQHRQPFKLSHVKHKNWNYFFGQKNDSSFCSLSGNKIKREKNRWIQRTEECKGINFGMGDFWWRVLTSILREDCIYSFHSVFDRKFGLKRLESFLNTFEIVPKDSHIFHQRRAFKIPFKSNKNLINSYNKPSY